MVWAPVAMPELFQASRFEMARRPVVVDNGAPVLGGACTRGMEAQLAIDRSRAGNGFLIGMANGD